MVEPIEGETYFDYITRTFHLDKRATVAMVENLYLGDGNRGPLDVMWTLLVGLRKAGYTIAPIVENEAEALAQRIRRVQ